MKIIAVADVAEAMVYYRPYRPAMGVQLVLDEIKSKDGILYCPKAVEACIALMEKKDYQIVALEHSVVFTV